MEFKVGHLETFKRSFAQDDFARFADLSGARIGGARLQGTRLEGAVWTDGRTCFQK